MSGQKKTFNWKLLSLIAVAFVIGIVSKQALSTEAPYPLWLDKYFNRDKVPQGIDAARRAKVIYNVAASSVNTGVYLPKNAVIVRSWYYVRTATTGGTGPGAALTSNVSFDCEDVGNIKVATDMSAYSADTIVEGASTGAASVFKSAIAAQCQVVATVTNAPMSTGVIELYIDYVVHD